MPSMRALIILAAGVGAYAAVPYAPKSLNVFSATNPWNTRVDGVAKDRASDTVINWLTQHGGWGMGNVLRIDFSINVLSAQPGTTPLQNFTPTADFYSPDCDHAPFPVPANGAVEGETGYACTHDGDCHLLVVDAANQRLYEMWRANIVGGKFHGGCAAVWNTGAAYGPKLRGQDCTSADAGGFPITPLLFSADEVASGSIDHAIRFILPNDRIRSKIYARPGTHSTSATTGNVTSAPPYGVRFRLRSDFDLSKLPSNGSRVIATALQRYGMFLADGGNMALTAANDAFTVAKWSDAHVNVDTRSLSLLKTMDFEVVHMTDNLVPFEGNCVRAPVPPNARPAVASSSRVPTPSISKAGAVISVSSLPRRSSVVQHNQTTAVPPRPHSTTTRL